MLAGRASWDDLDAALADHAWFIRDFVAEQPVQTNEVQRSWVLVPLVLRAAHRSGFDTLDLVELGPSAGLNLVLDRYRCVYGVGERGPADGIVLRGEERSPVPAGVIGTAARVRARVGVDRRPIDVTTEAGALLLKSFVWADQTERLERLDEAIAALRLDRPELVRGDFVELLPDVLDAQPDDGLTVVFQTATWRYLSDEQRSRVYEVFERVGAERPLAFVSTGSPRNDERTWGLRIFYWPAGEREFVGHADYHGTWLDWEAS